MIVKDFSNVQMKCGSLKEHQILDSLTLPLLTKDNQIIKRKLRLRINLDGNVGKTIYEVKTHSALKPYKLPLKHWRQVQAQMFGHDSESAYIVAYGLVQEDYDNFYLPIDPDRLQMIKVEFDRKWVEKEYLPKLKYLAYCLTKKIIPKKENFEKWIQKQNQ